MMDNILQKIFPSKLLRKLRPFLGYIYNQLQKLLAKWAPFLIRHHMQFAPSNIDWGEEVDPCRC